MDNSLAELVRHGKDSFESISQAGAFYFPNVLVGRPFGNTEMIQYPSGFDEFQIVLYTLSETPIEWAAHISDAWFYAGTDDDPVVAQIEAGITSCEEQFELENPLAYEALSVLLVTANSVEGAYLPYKRTSGGVVIEWIDLAADERPPTGRLVDAMQTAIKVSHSLVQ